MDAVRFPGNLRAEKGAAKTKEGTDKTKDTTDIKASSSSAEIDLHNYSSLVALRVSGELLTRSGARKLLVALAKHLLTLGDSRHVWYFDLQIWGTIIAPILLGRGHGFSRDFPPITFEQLVEVRPEYGFFGPNLADHYEFSEKKFWRWLVDWWAPKSVGELQATTNYDGSRYGDARRYFGLGLNVLSLLQAHPVSLGGERVWPLVMEFDRENLWTENTMFRPCEAEQLELGAALAYRFFDGTSLRLLLRDFCHDSERPMPNALSWPLPFTITESMKQMASTIGPIRYRRLCRSSFSAFQMDRMLGYRALMETSGLLPPLCDLVVMFLAGPQAQGVYSVPKASLTNWFHDNRPRPQTLGQILFDVVRRVVQMPSVSTYTDNLLSRFAGNWVNDIALDELSRVMDFTFRPQPVVACI